MHSHSSMLNVANSPPPSSYSPTRQLAMWSTNGAAKTPSPPAPSSTTSSEKLRPQGYITFQLGQKVN